MTPEERFERIEATLDRVAEERAADRAADREEWKDREARWNAAFDRITQLAVDTAERQSANEASLAKLEEFIRIDAENIRALARIA